MIGVYLCRPRSTSSFLLDKRKDTEKQTPIETVLILLPVWIGHECIMQRNAIAISTALMPCFQWLQAAHGTQPTRAFSGSQTHTLECSSVKRWGASYLLSMARQQAEMRTGEERKKRLHHGIADCPLGGEKPSFFCFFFRACLALALQSISDLFIHHTPQYHALTSCWKKLEQFREREMVWYEFWIFWCTHVQHFIWKGTKSNLSNDASHAGFNPIICFFVPALVALDIGASTLLFLHVQMTCLWTSTKHRFGLSLYFVR